MGADEKQGIKFAWPNATLGVKSAGPIRSSPTYVRPKALISADTSKSVKVSRTGGLCEPKTSSSILLLTTPV